MVDYIAPASDSASGVVSYPVTIRLTGDSLTRVLPGMTAAATITETETASNDSWLVPSSAIQLRDDGAVVLVVQEEDDVAIHVVPGIAQGEWTVVQSDALQAGDVVRGSVTSQIDEDDGGFGPPGGRDGGGPRNGGGPLRQD